MSKKDVIRNLFRHQIAGFSATILDFGVFNLLTYGFGIYYLNSHITGAIMGAIFNFIISTQWAFAGSKNSLKNQIAKYAIVSLGSLLLNVLFVYLLTDFGELHPNYSKVIAALFIAWTYNFVLMRYFVFKK